MTTKIGATYARRSSEKADDVSLKAQSDKSREYNNRAGIVTPPEYVFEEDDFTGRVADRPLLNEIFKLAAEGKINAITVLQVDRWARDVGAGAELIARVFKLGIELHFVSWGTYVRDTPMDYGRYNMEMLFSDIERRTIVTRFRGGKENKSKLGYLVGGGRYVRYGYKRVERTTEHGRIKDLEKDCDAIYPVEHIPSPAHLTHWIFEEVAKKHGVSAICDLLNDTYGLRRPGGRLWDTSDVYRIIHATEYKGEFYYGKRKGGKKQPVDDRLVISRPDLAIVSPELWDAANAALTDTRGNKPKNEYLFSRRVTCMHGHKMRCQPSHAPNGTLWLYYKCQRRRFIQHTCSLTYFRAPLVDSVVFGWVEELLKDPETKLRALQRAQRAAAVAASEYIEKIAACDATLEREEKELDHLYADRKQYRDNERMKGRIEKDIAETIERIDRVKKNREEYAQKVRSEVMTDDEIDYRISEIDRINALLRRLGVLKFSDRRQLIELLNITIVLGMVEERQYVDILWYGDSERKWLSDALGVEQLNLSTPGHKENQLHSTTPLRLRIFLDDAA